MARKREWVDYKEYLKSEEWKMRADEAKRVADYRCQVCNAENKGLDAHHRTYERLGCELALDITVLCRDCHDRFHSKERKNRTLRDCVMDLSDGLKALGRGDLLIHAINLLTDEYLSYLEANSSEDLPVDKHAGVM